MLPPTPLPAGPYRHLQPVRVPRLSSGRMSPHEGGGKGRSPSLPSVSRDATPFACGDSRAFPAHHLLSSVPCSASAPPAKSAWFKNTSATMETRDRHSRANGTLATADPLTDKEKKTLQSRDPNWRLHLHTVANLGRGWCKRENRSRGRS